jgi:peptidoglycan/LPS O-acetylase OafA/YrhL
VREASSEFGKVRLDHYDVLRGVAIVMVFLVHAGQQYLDGSRISEINSFLDTGKHGVAIFFFISGALLGRSLRGVATSSKNYLRYISKRLLRIYPAYLLSLLFLTIPNGPSLRDFLQHFFLVHSLDFRTFGSINYPYWSLSVEFLMYLIIPLLIWKTKDSNRITFLASLIGISLSWQIFGYIARQTTGFDPRNELSATLYLITALPAFAVGVYRQEIGKSGLGSKLAKTCSMLAIADLIMSFVRIFYDLQFWNPINQMMHGSTGYLAYGCLALYLSNALCKSEVKLKILVPISKISYSIYLWHLPILIFCMKEFGSHVLSLVIALFLTYIVSMLSFHFIERPFIIYSARKISLEVQGKS